MSTQVVNDCEYSGIVSQVAQKLERRQRLDLSDGLALYDSADVLQLGRLAEQVALQRVGPVAYYSINRHINYTNICRLGCSFCGFSRRPTQPDGYAMSIDEVIALAQQACLAGATEIHIVGGINPALPFQFYVEMIGGVHTACPNLHIKAFTAVEIVDMAQKSAKSVEEVLTILQRTYLGSLPGGGAEILCDEYFRRACPDKPTPVQWLDVHATAHRLGIPSNATMLYGHDETAEQRVRHMLKLRRLQDESLQLGKGRFQCFVPLPYVEPPDQEQTHRPDGTLAGAVLDLKTIAISRLLLDNIEHIKAFWPMLGVQIAQVALCFGADDLDGTVQDYRIVEPPDARDAACLSVGQLRTMITEAGKRPIQRDGFYQPLG